MGARNTQAPQRKALQLAETKHMSTTPDLSTPPNDSTTTGVFADAAGYLSAVEVHDHAAKQSASWSGGIYL
jgi:hypothetical protein